MIGIEEYLSIASCRKAASITAILKFLCVTNLAFSIPVYSNYN